ncbi:MAG: hypothetical protein J6I85_05345 [Clostridia bacterium]|nr:hypothetical protein [Clostridia bacterium]
MENDTDEGIKWEGSGRGTNTTDFDDFKGFLDNSGFINWAEGCIGVAFKLFSYSS